MNPPNKQQTVNVNNYPMPENEIVIMSHADPFLCYAGLAEFMKQRPDIKVTNIQSSIITVMAPLQVQPSALFMLTALCDYTGKPKINSNGLGILGE